MVDREARDAAVRRVTKSWTRLSDWTCLHAKSLQSCLTLCDMRILCPGPIRILCPWGFSRQEYWNGLSCPPPGDLPNRGIEPVSHLLHWQVGSLPLGPPGKPTTGNSIVKNPTASARDARDRGLIPGWGRYPGGGYGNTLQYSCLENSMDRGAQWTTVHGVAKSQTELSMHATLCYFKSLILSKAKEVLNNTQKHKIILTDGWRIFVNSSITLPYLKCSQ